MGAKEEVILFDLPSRDPCSVWSLNPWKTRMVLNFKKFDYKTSWIEYPDIEPTFKGFGIPPSDPVASGNTKPYSIPAIKLGDEYIMDSWPIVHAIEEKYPEPPLYLDSSELKEVRAKLPPLLNALRGVWMPKVPKNLLNPRSANYFERTRAEMFGLPLPEYAEEHGGEAAWAKAEPMIKDLADFVTSNGGPFILGKEPSYADIVIVTALVFFGRCDRDDYDRIISVGPALQKLVDACAPWLERVDH